MAKQSKAFDISKYQITGELQVKKLVIEETGDEIEVKVKPLSWSRRNKIVSKSVSDQENIGRYGKDAPIGRSFGQKTQPMQGKMKGDVPILRKTAPGSDALTTKDMPMNKKGGSIKKMKAGGMSKKMKAGGGVAKKGKAKGGKAKGGKSKVRGAGIAQRGVRPAQMR